MDTLDQIKYEQPLKAYENVYMPGERDHYTFDGWYEDVTCTQRFDFEKEIMPFANKVLYAKWIPKRYLVTVDADGGDMDPGSTFSTYFRINYNEMIDEYAGIRKNYLETSDGEYVYFDFSYKKLEEMGITPSDFPGALRKSFYLKANDVGSYFNNGNNITVGDITYSYKDYLSNINAFMSFIKKDSDQKDVTFTLSIRDTAAAYTEPINIVSDHLRTAFALGNDDVTVGKNSDDTFSVTLKKETEVKFSISNGLDLQYTVSGNYLTQSDSTELYIYNSGDENNVSIKKENGRWVKCYGSDTSTHTTGTPISYSTDGTLILGTQGQMVLFSEDNPTTPLHIKTAYYNTQSTPNGWTISTPQEGPLATPAFVLEEGTGTESVDGYSVNLINNNQSVTFGLHVSHTNTQYKFIGWYTTCGAAPNTPTVKGVVNGFGEENINEIAVPLNETTYYALYVPYANDNLNVTYNQKEDSPGSCASGNGLTLSVTYNNDTLTDEGDAADPALCSVAVDERALSPDVNYPIQIKVGALQSAPGAYDATFYNGQSVVGTKNTTTNYYEYTYDLDMKELLTASDSVKGLMKLNDVTFSSAFSLGYVITYRYTARDGRKHDYPRKISQL